MCGSGLSEAATSSSRGGAPGSEALSCADERARYQQRCNTDHQAEGGQSRHYNPELIPVLAGCTVCLWIAHFVQKSAAPLSCLEKNL